MYGGRPEDAANNQELVDLRQSCDFICPLPKKKNDIKKRKKKYKEKKKKKGKNTNKR